MMRHSKADIKGACQGQFESVVAEAKTHGSCGSTVAEPRGAQPDQSIDIGGAQHKNLKEIEILELAIQLIESTGIANNLPASMRLIEHIAETAGYNRAQHTNSTRVTELMLLAAQASALANEFDQD